ncbi:hypothetical protein D1007_45236 [Hordeum vulgare]|nr:hypothetical protein D1007_45236 [Hordeum vulgare]
MAHLRRDIEYGGISDAFWRHGSGSTTGSGGVWGAAALSNQTNMNSPVVNIGDYEDETMEDNEGGTYIPFVDDATTTRPDAPYVGFVFDTIEEAQMVYNSYAKKLGFGTRICYTKRTQKKGCNHIIRREFECVHAGGESTQDGGKQAVCDPEWYKIEEQASKFYTRIAFGKFKEMMEETTALIINPVEGE